MTTTRNEGFEKYLEQVCFEANPAVLDDDMPDFFDDWLGSQDGEDYIRIADEYAKSLLTTKDQQIAEAVKAERERKIEEYGFYDLVKIAQTMLDSIYPLDLFDGSSGNPGAVFTSRLHHALEALTPLPASEKGHE